MSIEKHGKIKNKSVKSLNKILSFIDGHCSTFLEAMYESEKFLYRGLPSVHDYFLASSPTNRSSMGLEELSRYLDYYLKSDHFSALRTNSICCNSDREYIGRMGFGRIYFIFPLNGFTFHWSPEVKDAGSSYFLAQFLRDKGQREKILFNNKFKFTNKNLSEALLKGNEIAIHGNYIAISYKHSDDVFNHYGFKG